MKKRKEKRRKAKLANHSRERPGRKINRIIISIFRIFPTMLRRLSEICPRVMKTLSTVVRRFLNIADDDLKMYLASSNHI